MTTHLSIVTRLRVIRPEFDSRQYGIALFVATLRPVLGFNQPPYTLSTEDLS